MSTEGEQTVLDDDGQPLRDPNDRLWLLLAHLGPIPLQLGALGFVAPLIVWFVKKEESPFLADQAKESLNFQISVLIVTAALILTCVGIVLLPVLYATMVVLCILATVKAGDGERYRYPLTLRLIS